jgi:tetratricopeptide (TPR) repeat protein
MSSKATGILAKAQADRVRGDFERALKRLVEAIQTDPEDITLHKEAIDIAVEAGESMRAVQFFKAAQQRLPDDFQELWQFGREKISAFNDPVLCKYLLDVAVRKRDLEAAEDVLDALKDHTASDLLSRTRNKRQSLGAASQSFKTEMTTNMMAEAMLCMRAKQFEDGARTFVQILDEKPAENQALTPYLAALHKKLTKKGVIAYALGCSCLHSADYARGVAMLVRGAQLSPATVQDAVKRIEALAGSPDVPQDEVEFALSQLLIIKGDVHIASKRLSQMLEKNHRRAPAILDLIEPQVETIGDNLVLNYLYVEAALVCGNHARARQQIKKVYDVERHRQDLLAWLELKSHERFMTVEILARYGEMALGCQMYEKSIEVFRRVLSQAPHEVHLIKESLAAHIKDASIKEFHDQLAEATAEEQSGDGFAIEHYGNSGFQLDTHSPGAEPEAPARRPAEAPSEVSSAFETTGPPPTVARRSTDVRTPPPGFGRRTTDMPPMRRATDVRTPAPPPSRRATDVPSTPATPSRRATNMPAPVPAPAPPAAPATPEPEAPAPAPAAAVRAPDVPPPPPVPAPEYGVAKTSSEDSPGSPEPPVILLGVSDIVEDEYDGDAPRAEAADEKHDDPPANDFDSLWRRFENGDLGNDEILELADSAIRLGKTKQLKALLTFTPTTTAQDTRRKYYLAEYYLEEDDPLNAIVLLKTVDLNGLTREERKTFMLKHAYCYQQLNQFDAAHGMYLKILSENPDFSEAEHMARVAYERHIASSTSDTVLQKVTRLQSESEEEES